MAAVGSVWFILEPFRHSDHHRNEFSGHLAMSAWHDQDPVVDRISLNHNYEIPVNPPLQFLSGPNAIIYQVEHLSW